MAASKQRLPEYQMVFESGTIEHLGLRLYSTLPPVINEFVTNAFDAESPSVEILVPSGAITPESEVVVRDLGHGMSPQQLQDEFLPIGRNRRGTDSSKIMSRTGKRHVTGRKGLGKLSGLGIANQIQVRSICNRYEVILRLRYDEMVSWAASHAPGQPYEPTVVSHGATNEHSGVEIRLSELRRKTPVSADDIRRGIARRLRLVGSDFEVKVNGIPIKAGDRVQKAKCSLSWTLKEIEEQGAPMGSALPSGEKVSGWIGFLDAASSKDRGIDIFASKKAVELGSFFNYGSTHAQFARAHVVGEIHANFLDAPEQDLASTARSSVVWEDPLGEELEEWGKKLLHWSFEAWLDARTRGREEKIVSAGKFEEWLAGRSETEQKTARRLVKVLAKNVEDLEQQAVVPLLEIVKASVETLAFNELVDAMEEEGSTVAKLLRLFKEWRVIEAREHLKLADGRQSVIEKLSEFIKDGALEVKELQPLLVDNLWLLDPGWSDARVEAHYSDLLREVEEPKDFDDKDRRLDIFGVLDAHRVTVVELKRPELKLHYKHLVQIENYVLWARAQWGSSTSSKAKAVDGLLVVGKMSGDNMVVQKIQALKPMGILVQTLSELTQRAAEYFNEIEKNLKAVAPEYARAKRKAKKKT